MKVTQNPTPNSAALEKSKAADKSTLVNPSPTDKRPPISPSSQSGVSISDQAQLMKNAREIVYASPDIRADKVSDLKRRIKDGSYKVDSEAIADKLVDEHLLSHFGKNDV